MSTLVERFWKRVDRGEGDECWIWKGARIVEGDNVVRYTYLGKERIRCRICERARNLKSTRAWRARQKAKMA